MTTSFNNLLSLIGRGADREEFSRLGHQYYEAFQSQQTNEQSAQRERILDQIMERMRWHFRAVRHPIPTRPEVEQMILDYFR